MSGKYKCTWTWPNSAWTKTSFCLTECTTYRSRTAIGNSLPGFIVEIYMCAFETRIENHEALPMVYARYLNNVFAVQNARKVKANLQLFNSQHARIQFTSEAEFTYENYVRLQSRHEAQNGGLPLDGA